MTPKVVAHECSDAGRNSQSKDLDFEREAWRMQWWNLCWGSIQTRAGLQVPSRQRRVWASPAWMPCCQRECNVPLQGFANCSWISAWSRSLSCLGAMLMIRLPSVLPTPGPLAYRCFLESPADSRQSSGGDREAEGLNLNALERWSGATHWSWRCLTSLSGVPQASSQSKRQGRH